jgi:hypothetical protein
MKAMAEPETPAVPIIDLDRLMVGTLELEDMLCFHCPLLERPYRPDADYPAFDNPVRATDLGPVVAGIRSGIKAAVVGGRIPAYAVFAPPGLFSNVEQLPFEVDEDALLVGALYAVPEAREENLDVDLLVAVMDFARAHGFAKVQVLCREGDFDRPEARAEVLRAAGFTVTGAGEGLCLAETTVAAWDESEANGEPASS